MASDPSRQITFSRAGSPPTERDRYWAKEARNAWQRSAERLEKEARRWVAALASFLGLFSFTSVATPTDVVRGTWQSVVVPVGAVTAVLAATIALVIAYATAFPAPAKRWPTGDELRRHARQRAALVAKRLPWVRRLTGLAIVGAVAASLTPVALPTPAAESEPIVIVEDGATSVCGRLASQAGVLIVDSGDELLVLPSSGEVRLTVVESCDE